ncbi:hypothetical protein M409DRAFT_50002 [Zasmidium cellare ATCC 36951]|uniref:Uncharacterized protein n=1 Tax=Zasmidium cellare ATCC 36951 TaxID=1080233 RepID=A0A6A6D268_ZASCE|nr:uncharacterized protein M409DRAFT_50002 [Zasmidium cellare ATCC 36951]KAF2172282.1 hypothetical protein M409DRAFT_50002 [Zasmidium cellare ATCC 36951]
MEAVYTMDETLTTFPEWNLDGTTTDGYSSLTGQQGSPKKRKFDLVTQNMQSPHPDEALKGLACLQVFATRELLSSEMEQAIAATHSRFPTYQRHNLDSWMKKITSRAWTSTWKYLAPRVMALIEKTGGIEKWMAATYHQRIKVFYDHFDAAPYCLSQKTFSVTKQGLNIESILGSDTNCPADKLALAKSMHWLLRYHFVLQYNMKCHTSSLQDRIQGHFQPQPELRDARRANQLEELPRALLARLQVLGTKYASSSRWPREGEAGHDHL